MLRIYIRVIFFGLIFGCVAELFFRFVIPASDPPFLLQDPEFNIVRCDTSKKREGNYTSGRLAQSCSRYRINNYGWNNINDYAPKAPGRKPVIAICGDSYIRGFAVNAANHVSAALQHRLDDRYLVYSFGEGGAPVSQYVTLADYAAQKFDPDVFVFLLSTGDIFQSVRSYERNGQYMQLEPKDSTFVEVPRTIPFRVSRIKRLVKHSAFVRYLVFNAYLSIFEDKTAITKPVNSDRVASDVYKDATRYLVERIVKSHPGKPVVFMVHASLSDVYKGNAKSQQVVQWLRDATSISGGYVLDLTPVFADRYATDHRRFDSEYEFHWNIYATTLSAMP